MADHQGKSKLARVPDDAPMINPRAHEHEAHQGYPNIARRGGAPKIGAGHPPPVHDGMAHTDRNTGLHVRGISSTTLTEALQSGSGPSPMDPTVDKKLSPPAINPGTRNRNNDTAHSGVPKRVRQPR